ncbi:MAG TPA: glycosyltransferase family 39 protein [Candidatus Portnoybacteria bacterium]|nr:glycosyltransferase family 39 protein [Candidatus Portnoybacteria bacterium]
MDILKKTKDCFLSHKVLIIILLLSFLASLAYSFYFKIVPAVDARAYDNIAQNIASGNGYREYLAGDLASDYAIARVGPLYEYFLAGIYKVFGHSYSVVWLFQALLHAASAWLIYLAALLIFSANDKRKKIAIVAAAIFGFYPDLIEISAMLMTETLYLFFVCLMVYFFFLFFLKGGYRLVALLGLFSGLAVLARPPVLFLVPVILFYFWQKRNWRQALLFLAILILVFVPWTARNYQVYGEIMPFGSAGNFNFWIGNYHGGNGEQEPTIEQQQFLQTHKAVEINSESMKHFKEFLFAYPAEFLKLTALRVNKYFSIIRPMGFWFYQAGIGQMIFVFCSAIASVFLLVFGLAGAIKAWSAKEKKLNYLLAFLAFTPLIIFATVVETRYRFQIYPLLTICASYFAIEALNVQGWRRQKLFIASAIIIFFNGFIDMLLSWEKIKDRFGSFFNF